MIKYLKNVDLNLEDIILVFEKSSINRPIGNKNRIKSMFDNSNLIISAWDQDKLVGLCRALTDFSYCCYLSDLAVDMDYQRQGIGKTMIDLVKKEINDEVALILLSAPSSMSFYPNVGFGKIENDSSNSFMSCEGTLENVCFLLCYKLRVRLQVYLP